MQASLTVYYRTITTDTIFGTLITVRTTVTIMIMILSENPNCVTAVVARSMELLDPTIAVQNAQPGARIV